MTLRGERFDIDLSSDEDDHGGPPPATAQVLPGFIKDVAERPASAATPPSPPVRKPTSHGFPAHKNRIPTSRFKQSRTDNSSSGPSGPSRNDEPTPTPLDPGSGFHDAERQDIDKENRQRLAQMSDASIAKERQELMEGLSPSLIQRLLRRANIDEPQVTRPRKQPSTLNPSEPNPTQFAGHSRTPDEHIASEESSKDPDAADAAKDSPLDTPIIPTTVESLPTGSTHFPRIPQPPPLDPYSPSFLTELHEKYYPDLPHDPSKLAWMKEDSSDPNNADSHEHSRAYDPSLQDIPIAGLRFNFTGTLLPPSMAQAIPVSKGLHHHGDAPDAAGYTIGELAHLSRSQFPTQRCFAFQTLGRILYRLGKGEFGPLARGFGEGAGEGEGEGLANGLWDCVRQGRVLETLEAEANRDGGHVSAKAYAVEALWLWRKGGGTEVRAT